jgi:streptogramin lyase
MRIRYTALARRVTAGAGIVVAFTTPARAGEHRAAAVAEFAVTVGAGPTFVATGPDGTVWFTEINGNRIGRMRNGGELTEFPSRRRTAPRSMSPPGRTVPCGSPNRAPTGSAA